MPTIHLLNWESYGYSFEVSKAQILEIKKISASKTTEYGANPKLFKNLKLLFCPTLGNLKKILKIIGEDAKVLSEQVCKQETILAKDMHLDWVCGEIFPRWHDEDENPSHPDDVLTYGVYLSA